MLWASLGLNQLRPNNISHAIGGENGGCHEALLRMACHVGHADGNDEAHRPAEKARNRVPNHGGGSPVRPLALPDEGTARNDGQACQDEHDEANVGNLGPQITRQKNDDKA